MPRLLPKPRRNRLALIKLSAMGDVLKLAPVADDTNRRVPTTIITTWKSNPDFIKSLVPDVEIIELNLNPKSWFTALRALYGANCVDLDQYYRVSEFLCNFGPSLNQGFLTPMKGISTQQQLTYEAESKEHQLFCELVTLATSCPSHTRQESIESGQRLSRDPEIPLLGQHLIVLYPGSGNNATMRRWPLERFAKTAHLLDSSKRQLIVAGGPDEMDFDASAFPDHALNLIGRLTLHEWASVFRNRDVIFIGNDGTTLHVAELAGAKTVGIFGPAPSAKWGMGGEHNVYLQGHCSISPCIRTHAASSRKFAH